MKKIINKNVNSFKNFSVKQTNKSWPKFLIGGIIILFLLVILNFFVSPVKNYFYTLSAPIQKTFWSAGVSSSTFFSSFIQGESLIKENENLKSENQKLLSQIAALQSIEQGNQAQSDVSAACQNSGFNLVPVGVMGLDDNDVLSISKGSADGISPGMPVINEEKVLFGKVSKVYKNFSNVMLISNKNSVVNVKILQADPAAKDITGNVNGLGGLNAYLDSIQIQDTISQGDVLVTYATDQSFPENLLVGKITQVTKNDQKPFQQAQLRLFFDVKTTDNLFVITNYKNEKSQ